MLRYRLYAPLCRYIRHAAVDACCQLSPDTRHLDAAMLYARFSFRRDAFLLIARYHA